VASWGGRVARAQGGAGAGAQEIQKPAVMQGCSVLKILPMLLRGSEADEAVSGLQRGDCFDKIRLAMT